MNPPHRLAAVCALLLVTVWTGSCNQTRARSFIGGPCSTRSGDDPFYECDPRYDLICLDQDDDGDYHCRTPCSLGQRPNPCEPGDVCCPGDIHGNDMGVERGCVPRIECPTTSGGDASVPDASFDSSNENTGGTLDSGR